MFRQFRYRSVVRKVMALQKKRQKIFEVGQMFVSRPEDV
jgi:hypothetical protein